LRLAASIRHGTVTASLIIRKLASSPAIPARTASTRHCAKSGEQNVDSLCWSG